jgi:transcriptional regulator with XRE-family HTH domain
MNVEGTPDVGARVKELREQRRLSLRSLAEICDVSHNTVSLIERGVSSPSIDTLQRLASGLGVSIAAFFEIEEQPSRMVLISASSRVQSRASGTTIEHLGSGLARHAFASFLITMEAGATTDSAPIQHTGVEWVYCLEGSIGYEVDGTELQLMSGDNLLFDASLPHRWRNLGRGQAQMLLILDAGEHHDLTAEQHLQT